MLGDKHLSTLISAEGLGILLLHMRRYEEAEALTREALEGMRVALGERHPQTLQSLNTLATLLGETGRASEEEALNLEIVNIRRETQGDLHKATLDSMYNYASCIEAQGREAGLSSEEKVFKLEAAQFFFEQVLEGYKATLQERDPDISDCARRVYRCKGAANETRRLAALALRRIADAGDSDEEEEDEDEDEGWVTDESA